MAIHMGLFSAGVDNSKTGCPTFGLTAVETCTNCEVCERICYARKLENLYPTVARMHKKSTEAVRLFLELWE